MCLLISRLLSFIDINECSAIDKICDANAVCKNIEGSYTCTCRAGYNGDGKTCSGKYFMLIQLNQFNE